MVPEVLKQWVTTPVEQQRDTRVWVWFSFSIAIALIYSFMGLQQAFGGDYVIHDDVRSHVFWMYRFLDPGLFPNDLIADYFQSVAPYGYTKLYLAATSLGLDPIFFNKMLPLVLVLVTTGFCFWVAMAMFPVPAASFIATLLLNQTTWNTHDIPSGTPRAFLYPLFVAFLYYLIHRSLIPCLLTILLQGLFYPQCLFLSSGILILRLLQIENGRLRLSGDRRDYIFCATGLGVAFVMLLPYALKISDYGPVLTLSEARTIPTLQGDGRKNFFFEHPFKFWFCGERSGMFPYNWCKYERPPQLWASVLFLWVWLAPKRFPLVRKLTTHASILPHILLSSLGMFFLAHLLLFRLHLPSRYTKHSIRILVAFAGAIALVCLFDVAIRWIQTHIASKERQSLLSLGATGLLSLYVFGYPLLMDRYPNPDYVTAEAPAIYDFFAQQPQDILIASLSEQANNIPSLSQRSILTSSEIANPYHMGYYQTIQTRTMDLMRAQYSLSRRDLRAFIEQYGIDFWLIDVNAFEADYIFRNSWLRELEPIASEAMQQLNNGDRPILARWMRRCEVLESEGRVVVDAACLLTQGRKE